jgi:hypothetical protein
VSQFAGVRVQISLDREAASCDFGVSMASRWTRNQEIAVWSIVVTILIAVCGYIFERHSSSNSVNNNGSTIGTQQNYYGGTQQIVQPSPAPPTQATQPAPTAEKKTPSKPKSKSQPTTKVESSPNRVVNPQGSVTLNQNGTIVNNAPNLGNQTINNSPPLPNVTIRLQKQLAAGVSAFSPSSFMGSTDALTAWQQELARKKEATKNLGVAVIISVDKSFANAAFRAQCDRPCTHLDAIVMDAALSSISLTQTSPTTLEIAVVSPGVLLAGQQLKWEFRSLNQDAVTITGVKAVAQ